MSKDTISETLEKIKARYSDGRLNVFELSAEQPAPDRCVLSGTVLDQALLENSLQQLRTAFPEITFDAVAVTILRKSPAQLLALNTNLAGVHRHPSRKTELMTQVLNGTIVERLREEDSWLFVRQEDGYLGWVQGAYLTPDLPLLTPTHMVYEPLLLMLAGADEHEKIISRVFAGTAVSITDTSGAWAKIELVGGYSGWVPAKALQPLDSLPQTAAERRALMASKVADFIGVPYRWGGSSAYGIDCSGFVQLLYRLAGVTIPRDADMQYAAGKSVELPFQVGDLFYFGSEGGHRAISHVGISLGGWRMIHSSGSRNGV
ncbi:MAG: NlpC/P60 family protein, partial [Candidatus Promineifilaceae bacterium]